MSIDARIADNQPDSFAFTRENEAEIKRIVAKYPKGRQASAVMPLLDLAQRQHDNWIPMKAIELSRRSSISLKSGFSKSRPSTRCSISSRSGNISFRPAPPRPAGFAGPTT